MNHQVFVVELLGWFAAVLLVPAIAKLDHHRNTTEPYCQQVCPTVNTADPAPCPSDWKQYKDDYCYQLFKDLKSFSEAENVCLNYSASLVSIHDAEEQTFISDYLFSQKTVENVWIGLKYNLTSKQFQWADNSVLTDDSNSNWAPGNPKSLPDHCVEMLAEEGLEGNWSEQRCTKQNFVFCQQIQKPTLDQVRKAVFDLKHSLQLTNSELKESKSKLATAERKIQETEKALTKTTSDLDETKKELTKTISDLDETKTALTKTTSDLDETKKELNYVNNDVLLTKQELWYLAENYTETRQNLLDVANRLRHCACA